MYITSYIRCINDYSNKDINFVIIDLDSSFMTTVETGLAAVKSLHANNKNLLSIEFSLNNKTWTEFYNNPYDTIEDMETVKIINEATQRKLSIQSVERDLVLDRKLVFRYDGYYVLQAKAINNWKYIYETDALPSLWELKNTNV